MFWLRTGGQAGHSGDVRQTWNHPASGRTNHPCLLQQSPPEE